MGDIQAGMNSYAARLETFHEEHHVVKRRASTQKKKSPNTVAWPHETPTPEDLARAGFSYKPSADSNDNVQCFLCAVKLDGWESGDVPLLEHLAHSAQCGWAISSSVSREGEDRDPTNEELVEARTATYGSTWPHEGKKGWKCKTKKMVEAGWTYDPAPDADDGVTCFYCNLSLDGWEPKDNPLDEHRKRSPDCAFFALSEHYAATKPASKSKKSRTSRGSKVSRLSTQSIQSTFSEAPSLMSLGDAAPIEDADMDDSVATVATTTSTTGKGRKKAAKAKAPTKSKKKAVKEEISEPTVAYPDLEASMQVDEATESQVAVEPAPKTRGGRRNTKLADSSIIQDTSMAEVAPKPTRGRGKAKQQQQEQSQDESQLQSELLDAVPEAPIEQSPPRPQRGTKRTSDGLAKVETVEASSIEESAPPQKKRGRPAAKAKKGKKAVEESQDEDQIQQSDMETAHAEEEVAPTQPLPKAKQGRKVSKQVEAEPVAELENEEAEMEAPLVVMEKEQEFVVREPSPAAEDFEPTPTPQKTRPSHMPGAWEEPTAPDPESTHSTPQSVRSHQSSDAENHPPPSTVRQPPASIKAAGFTLSPTQKSLFPQPHSILTSPTKTTRIPLAASTPNRSPRRSPQKLGQLTSAIPWQPADLETVFFPSPEKENEANVRTRLVEVGGGLTSPEKKMTVEEWVRWRAAKGEEKLRQDCERLVSLFEREGTRGLEVLGGLQVV